MEDHYLTSEYTVKETSVPEKERRERIPYQRFPVGEDASNTRGGTQRRKRASLPDATSATLTHKYTVATSRESVLAT